MIREYLDGKKKYDVRLYDTNKRGTIALVDTRKPAIIGLIDSIRTHKIIAVEYCNCHATGKWERMILQVEDMNATFFAYDFANPRRLASPIQITMTGRTWTNIDEGIQFVFQESMF